MDLVLGVGASLTKRIPIRKQCEPDDATQCLRKPPSARLREKATPCAGLAVIVLAVLAAAWAGVWFWAAGWANLQATRTLQELAQRGVEVDCRDRTVSDFPLRSASPAARLRSRSARRTRRRALPA